MLKISNLYYKQRRSKEKFAIDNISFELEEGMLMCLLGKNGAGKTTLLNLIYGIQKRDSGDIIWYGNTINADNMHEYHSEVAYVGDEQWCVTWRSILENVAFLSSLYPDFDKTLFMEIMEKFGMTQEDMSKAYSVLSTGQRVQFSVAFALARKPKLLLLDEPFANLDPVIKSDLVEILQEVIRHEGASAIVSTHLVEELSDMTDYIGVLAAGRMKEFGDRERILEQYNSLDLRKLMVEIGGAGTWR